MQKRLYKAIIFVISTMSIGCSNDGQFGHSASREEALANGSTVTQYQSETTTFPLLDGTMLMIDTAWTEMSFTYSNGTRVFDTAYGYHFTIPFRKQIAGSFNFSFELADSSNRVFTNGMDENFAQLCPRVLYDQIKVLLVQKNPDSSLGWTRPIVTDTLVFLKIKN